jgi:esterase
MRPLVILHGLFGSSRNWKTISNKLAAELQNDKILSIDLRNHNQFNNVDAPRGPIKSWRTLQDDLEAYWKLNLKGQDFDLLGHSFVSKLDVIKFITFLRVAKFQ